MLCDDMTWGESAQMIVSGDGRALAALGNDGLLRTWDLDSRRQFDPLPKIGNAAAMALSHDGQMLAAAVGNRVTLLHLANGERQTLEADGAGKICCLAFDPTGLRLLAVDRQAAIFGWQMPQATPELPRRHELEQLPMARRALSRDLGTWPSRDDRQIEIRRVDDTEGTGTITRLPGHGATVTRLAFSTDGQKLVSGDSHGLLKIWSTRPASTDFTYTKHTAGINDLAINRRQRIASADDQGEIHLWWWDPLANQLHPERILRANAQEVLAVDFNSQGNELASGGRDGQVRIWNVETGRSSPSAGRRTQET